MKTKHKPSLKRTLSLWQLSLYGVGIILGAGIYALIGQGAAVAGNALWLSFIIAAVVASFTGLSYAELSSMCPKEAAEYNYTKRAFGFRKLSFFVGWIMIVAGIIASATVALGFGGYFSYLFGGSPFVIAAGLIVLLSLINFIGIRESAAFNIVGAIVEIAGLIIVVLVGLFFVTGGAAPAIDFFETPNNVGFAGIMAATLIIFFAYIGYEEIANVSEETKKAATVVPKAIIIAMIISTVLYILVSLTSVSVLGWEKLSASKAPLTEVVSTVIPQADVAFSFIALFATSNTVLALLIATSRIFCGMSRDNAMPSPFSAVGKRGTPYTAVFTVMSLALGALMLGGIKTAALLTDLSIFAAYFFVNLALIALRFSEPNAARPFRVPGAIGKLPIIPTLGVASCAVMLLFFEPTLWLYEIGILAVGFLFYAAIRKKD